MAETIGTLVDKLSIVELRRWHTEEAMLNPDAPVEVRHECALRLAVIDEQRADLAAELSALWEAIMSGREPPKVYRALKMYNDDALRSASQREPEAPTERHEARNVIAFRRRTA
jgi:hypothetical protein